MTSNFRQLARSSLTRANEELKSLDDDRLKYAALELRMAIEGLTYDRAEAFKAEIPPAEYGIWQPRKVMQLLLDIDPLADQTAIFSIGVQESAGVPAKQMHSLGKDTVFNLKSIKTHYDALGSHLHLQTLKQVEAGAVPDTKALRFRCNAIVAELEAVLASPVYNITLGSFATLPCGRCQKPIRRRIPIEAQQVEVKCFECGAPYEITRTGPKSMVEWHAKITTFSCLTEACEMSFPIWSAQVKTGVF